MLNLDAIKERLAAAEPGPWKARPSAFDSRLVTKTDESGMMRDIARVYLWGSETQCLNNALLIAHAPTDLAALIQEVEHLRKAERNRVQNLRFLLDEGHD